jgi:hypothetical protein
MDCFARDGLLSMLWPWMAEREELDAPGGKLLGTRSIHKDIRN